LFPTAATSKRTQLSIQLTAFCGFDVITGCENPNNERNIKVKKDGSSLFIEAICKQVNLTLRRKW